jgi:SAM-dependent methyltransferase
LLDLLRNNISATSTTTSILDVGRSSLTTMMAEEFQVRVDSLGLEPGTELSTGQHHSFDLNKTDRRECWPVGLGPYDVVVFAEVVEHLYTAPELVLEFLWSLLVPEGLLILQTPNAASLGKRVKLAFGVNPFERFRADKSNPGHYREYTLVELVDALGGARFTVYKSYRKFYFDARFAHHDEGNEPPNVVAGAVRNVLYRILPPPLREGITILARRRG